MTCDELETRLILGEEDVDLVAHLARCSDCRARKERHDATARAMKDLVADRARPLSAGLRDRVLDALPAAPARAARPSRLHPGLLAFALVAAGASFVVFHAPVAPRPESKPLPEAPAPQLADRTPREPAAPSAPVTPDRTDGVSVCTTTANPRPLDPLVASGPVASVASATPAFDSREIIVALDSPQNAHAFFARRAHAAPVYTASLAALDEVEAGLENSVISYDDACRLSRDIVIAQVGTHVATRVALKESVDERVKNLKRMNADYEARSPRVRRAVEESPDSERRLAK